MIRIDMEKNNEFVANAHTWRETKIPYDQHRAVGKVLKEWLMLTPSLILKMDSSLG